VERTAAHLIGYLSEITEAELKSEKYLGYYPGEDIGKVGVEGLSKSISTESGEGVRWRWTPWA